MPELTTSRLILRRWTERDILPMAVINADPEVMRWISDGKTLTHDETRTFIERCEALWNTHRFGLFAIERRDTSDLVGFAGLSIPTFLPEVLPNIEIGWRLGRPFWGQGFATEAAKASMRFGFDACGLHELISICQVGNTASERIMQKLDMHLQHETIHPLYSRRLRVYARRGDTSR